MNGFSKNWVCNRRIRLLVVAACLLSGCRTPGAHPRSMPGEPETGFPRELQKTTLPTYRIEAPDILLIDAVRVVPQEPYELEPLDSLTVLVSGTPEDQPILGEYRVDSSGTVVLGPGYGRVKVVGLSIDEAQQEIQRHLEQILSSPETSVSLAEPAARQAIAGEHLVGQDGTINLGIYGNVRVVGLTVAQARAAIEDTYRRSCRTPKLLSTSQPTTARSITSSPRGPATATRYSASLLLAMKRFLTPSANSVASQAYNPKVCGSRDHRPTA